MYLIRMICRVPYYWSKVTYYAKLAILKSGEPVYQVLRERYGFLELGNKIKVILADERNLPREVVLNNKKVSLLPLPHIFNKNNRQWKFYDDFLTDKLGRLSEYYRV